jgi:hypothetical protein
MMAALAPREQLVVAVVSASEDASPESPEAYAVVSGEPVGRFAKYFVDAAVAPAVESDDCGVACPATPRFQAWADASDGVPLETWAPGDKGPLSGGLSAPLCTPHCVDAPPEPPANCRLFVFPRDAGVCPAELGWFRPEPPLAGDESSCEVRALDGGALESCRTDLSCADCEPGYCFTDVPDLASACTAKGKLTFPRVIAGTGPNEPERFRLVCQVD